MNNKELSHALHVALTAQDPAIFNKIFTTSHPADIGAALQTFDSGPVLGMLARQPARICAALFRYLDAELQMMLTESLDRTRLADLFLNMSPDDRVDLFNRLSLLQRDAAAVQVEATLDFRKSGAVGRLGVSLKEASINLLYRKRVFWLVLLVFGNLFSGAGLAFFEDVIAANIALVFFLPLLIDSGGNAGSQSATLMVRALATGDVKLRDWSGMLMREVGVAGLLGITMALAVSLIGLWRGGWEIAIVVALTMQLVVVVGSVIGMSLPFLLSRFKMDPAAASAPLITSIADFVGVMIYFGIAASVLRMPTVSG